MARYGDSQEFVFTGKEGKETKFALKYPGLEGADMIMDEMRTDGGKTEMKALRKLLFEHVIRTEEGTKVSYGWFEHEDRGEDGVKMLKEVTDAALNYIFPKA